ncbi:MAG: sulfatase, partial [Planctomycetota bacterium]
RNDPGQVTAVWIHPVVETTTLVPRRTRGYGKNILLLVVDALRADHLSGYGYERPTTPHLDAHAREGVRFTNALAQSSWTIPSTATLLTGQYSYTHGLYDAYHWFLVPGIQTITQSFLQAGVRTAAFVANKLISEDTNFATGFELFHEVPFSTAAQLNASFLNWLDGYGDEPFFAYVHYMEPHMPYAAPGAGFHRFGAQQESGEMPDPERSEALLNRIESRLASAGSPRAPEKIMTEQEKQMLQLLIDLYDSEISYWDERFGLLMDALKARGLFEDTIIVITSDHGEEFLDHGMFRHGQGLHDELLHVPLVILNAPQAAETRDEMVGLIDVAPTLLALSRIPVPEQSGNEQESPDPMGLDLFSDHEPHRILFAETAHGLRRIDSSMHVERAAFSEKWKGILTMDDNSLALFDRVEDPAERRDLSSEESEVRDEFMKLIREWVERSRAAAPYNISVFDASALDKLREMGYIK